MQIHFVKERQHWVASSYQNGQVKLYDSLFNGKIAPSLEVQLAQLYRPNITNSHILVTAEPAWGGMIVGFSVSRMPTM